MPRFTVFITRNEQDNLYGHAIVTLHSADNITPAVISDLLLKQTERLFGLYDSTLLGIAYRAFNWTTDEQYNEQRRSVITNYFMTTLQQYTFHGTETYLYLALPADELLKWVVLVQSIGSRPSGETYLYHGVAYTALSKQGADRPIKDSRVLDFFRTWFAETKKSEQR